MSTWLIAKKEITENIISHRNIITSTLCIILFLLSIFLLSRDYQHRRESYDMRDVLGQTRTGKRPKIAKEPTKLSVLVKGLDENMGRLLFIWWGQPNRMETGAEVIDTGLKNQLMSLFATPDFVYIVKIVLSLLALFFAYDAICGEKQRGTLRLMLSNSVSRGSMLLGKWLGGFASFLLCFLPALLLVLIWMVAFPVAPLNGEDWARIGLIVLLSLMYISIFFSLGLFVSAITHRTATALLIILFLWVIWAITVPNLGVLIAQRLEPVPEPQDIISQKRDVGRREYDSTLEYFEACWKVDDNYIAMVNKQANLAQQLSRFSPFASYTYAVTTIARTGMNESQRYKHSVIEWDRNIRRVAMTQHVGAYDWQEKVPFVYHEMSLVEGLNAVTVDIVLLILFNVLLFMAACIAFLRYDVR